ncbi:MAG: hypothetical protein A4E69_01614 [Syntrophus sp. PtaB.Bin138]|nr:MAG: hypothetical protein A4E69_01614 [Syntrophus sp. PtaB.Bin138]
MKRMFPGMLLLAVLTVLPLSAKAGVDVGVHIGIPLPPPIVFSVPPVTIVIPETYIYAVPDVPHDLFFYGGFWWRPWEGRWYRSPRYDKGWAYYQGAPAFYRHVPPAWRDDYRNRRWKGHPWNRHRVPASQLPQNWRGWERDKHWEKQQHWGVPAMKTPRGAPPPHRSVQPPARPEHPDMRGPKPRPEPRAMNRPPHEPKSHGGERWGYGHQGEKHGNGKGEGGKGHGRGHGNGDR